MGNSSSRSSTSGPEVTYLGLREVPRTEAGYRVTDGNIAAIDFGTTSVSLAYTTKGDNRVSVIQLESETRSVRVLNVFLFSTKEGKMGVDAFGTNARKKYGAMRQGNHSNYIYFERIKSLLRRDRVCLNKN